MLRINFPEYFGNTFTNELYQIIYTQIFKSHQGQTNRIDNIIMEQLQSPQKEQFISLFIELKTKNVFKLYIIFYSIIKQYHCSHYYFLGPLRHKLCTSTLSQIIRTKEIK